VCRPAEAAQGGRWGRRRSAGPPDKGRAWERVCWRWGWGWGRGRGRGRGCRWGVCWRGWGRGPRRQAVEFDHAISYVHKIETRFSKQESVYKGFLEIPEHVPPRDQQHRGGVPRGEGPRGLGLVTCAL